jgi:hypothetical protein
MLHCNPDSIMLDAAAFFGAASFACLGLLPQLRAPFRAAEMLAWAGLSGRSSETPKLRRSGQRSSSPKQIFHRLATFSRACAGSA